MSTHPGARSSPNYGLNWAHLAVDWAARAVPSNDLAMTNALLRQVLAPLGVIAALLSGLAAAPSAQAAPDTTGPTLTVSPVSSYVLGQATSDTISEEYPDQNGLWFEEGGAYRVFRWSATDPSGICRYTVDEEHGAEGWTDAATVISTHSTSGKYTYHADEFSHSDSLSAIQVNAYDCAGNVTSVRRSINQAHVERDYDLPFGMAGRAPHACARLVTAWCVLRPRTRRSAQS